MWADQSYSPCSSDHLSDFRWTSEAHDLFLYIRSLLLEYTTLIPVLVNEIMQFYFDAEYCITNNESNFTERMKSALAELVFAKDDILLRQKHPAQLKRKPNGSLYVFQQKNLAQYDQVEWGEEESTSGNTEAATWYVTEPNNDKDNMESGDGSARDRPIFVQNPLLDPNKLPHHRILLCYFGSLGKDSAYLSMMIHTENTAEQKFQNIRQSLATLYKCGEWNICVLESAHINQVNFTFKAW